MKENIRRLAAFFLALALVIGLGPGGRSASDAIFLCINDVFINNMTSGNLPVKINNNMYISYRYLGRLKPIKYSYDTEGSILKIYNSSSTLIFDAGSAITYDQDGKIYSYLAVKRGGVLFVPIEFICRMFGIYYSQFTSTLGTVVRINSVMSPYSDSQIVSDNRDVIQDIYDAYYGAPEPDEPDDPPVVVTPPDPVEPDEPDGGQGGIVKTVYLAFVGSVDNGYTADILDRLGSYGLHAAFFVGYDGLRENSDGLRGIVCGGHTLGLYVSAADPLGEAEKINEALSGLVMRRSRLVCVKEGSTALTAEQRQALSDAGYRIWDASLDPGARGNTAYSMGREATRLLEAAPRLSVLRLYNDERSAAAVGTAMSYIRRNGWNTGEINEWTTPINAVRYYK